MTHKGRKFSPEHCAKLSAAKRGRKLSPEHRAKITAGMMGHTVSAEAKAKSSVSQRGKPKSESARAKMHGPKSLEHRERLRAVRTGTNATDAARENMRRAAIGKPKTAEHRANISAALKGRARPVWPDRGPTTIELAIRGQLEVLGISFEAHRKFGPYTADFYLPEYQALVECDGDYWHSLPTVVQRDARRDKWFAAQDIVTVRLKECDIRKDALAAALSAVNHLRERVYQ